MNYKYFFKLINNEKLEVSFDEFTKYVNNVNTMQVIEKEHSRLFIMNNQILFAYTIRLEAEDEE